MMKANEKEKDLERNTILSYRLRIGYDLPMTLMIIIDAWVMRNSRFKIRII